MLPLWHAQVLCRVGMSRYDFQETLLTSVHLSLSIDYIRLLFCKVYLHV